MSFETTFLTYLVARICITIKMSLSSSLPGDLLKLATEEETKHISVIVTDDDPETDNMEIPICFLDDKEKINPNEFLLGKKNSDIDRIDGISNAIRKIKEELSLLKIQDKHLASNFIKMINQVNEERSSKGKNARLYTEGDKPEKEFFLEKLDLKNAGFPVDNQFFNKNKRATWTC